MLDEAQQAVVDTYRAGSCIRRPSPDRRAADGGLYHKGWEIRFYAATAGDVERIVGLMADAGLRAGRPYPKRRRWVVPLYGRRQVDTVMTWAADVAARYVSVDLGPRLDHDVSADDATDEGPQPS